MHRGCMNGENGTARYGSGTAISTAGETFYTPLGRFDFHDAFCIEHLQTVWDDAIWRVAL